MIDAYPLAKNDDLSVFQKYHTHVPDLLKIHCVIQYAATATIALSLSLYFKNLSISEHLIIVGFAILSSFSIGALMENQHYAGVLEWLRLAVLISVAVLLPIPAALMMFLVISSLVCLPLLWFGRRESLYAAV